MFKLMSLFIHVVIPSNRSLGNSSTVESKIGALGSLCGFDNLRGVDVMLCLWNVDWQICKFKDRFDFKLS